MIRRSIKEAIANALAGTAGLKAVFLGEPKRIDGTQLPCVIISLPDTDETRSGSPAPLAKKKLDFTAQLKVFHLDPTPDGVAGELAFDDLLDAIDAKLRADYTLGGSVNAATVQFIKTDVSQPMLTEGQVVARLAIKKFDATKWVTG